LKGIEAEIKDEVEDTQNLFEDSNKESEDATVSLKENEGGSRVALYRKLTSLSVLPPRNPTPFIAEKSGERKGRRAPSALEGLERHLVYNT